MERTTLGLRETRAFRREQRENEENVHGSHRAFGASNLAGANGEMTRSITTSNY